MKTKRRREKQRMKLMKKISTDGCKMSLEVIKRVQKRARKEEPFLEPGPRDSQIKKSEMHTIGRDTSQGGGGAQYV